MKENLNILNMETLQCAADCFKVMAHPVRLRIVDLLMQGQFAVHELAELCEISPHQACEHLRLMKGHGYLASERRGRTVYYRINAPQLPGMINCVKKNCMAVRQAADSAPSPYPTAVENDNVDDEAHTL